MKDRKIKVLVVEDSHAILTLLVHLLNSDPQIQVIGTASNGQQALEFLSRKAVDLVLMDVELREMDGFETTRRIMESKPVPIVICTPSSNSREAATAFRLMEAGAVACVEKPVDPQRSDFETTAAHLLQTVKLMSEVKVVRRWPRSRTAPQASGATASPIIQGNDRIPLIGIGASTGGPPVLQTILSAVPKDFPAAILIVQHIASGFLEALVDWLNQTTGMKVHIAAYGTHPLAGHAYLAPDDYHMEVRADGVIILNKEAPESGLRPSVSHLFRSLADSCGSSTIGVLLTGMGRDGADELKRMRDCGCLTIAQDRETSVVYGMPGEAVALDAADFVLPADKIAPLLIAHLNHR